MSVVAGVGGDESLRTGSGTEGSATIGAGMVWTAEGIFPWRVSPDGAAKGVDCSSVRSTGAFRSEMAEAAPPSIDGTVGGGIVVPFSPGDPTVISGSYVS